MFSNILFGRYIYKDSIIHKLNPFIKLLSLILIMIISLNSNIYENILILLLIFSIINFTEIEYKNFYKNIYGLRYLIISILMIDIIFNADIPLIINSILKIIIVVLYSNIFMTTTTINELFYSLNKILKPLKIVKIDTNKMILIMTISIKFIPLVTEQTDIIFKSFKIKGINFKEDKLKKISLFITSLFYSLLEKADNISNLLEIRNFNLNNLIKQKKYKINCCDIMFILTEIIIICAIKGVI